MKDVIAKLDYNTDPEYQSKYATAINWLSTYLDPADLEHEFRRYARSIGREADARSIPRAYIRTEGKIAYCINLGAKLEDRSVQKIIDLLDKASNGQVAEDATTIDDAIVETARSRYLASYMLCYNLIDNTILAAAKSSKVAKTIPDEVRTMVRKYGNGKDKLVRNLEAHYREVLTDAQMTNSGVENWVKPLTSVIDTLELMSTNSRKPRKRKISAGNRDKKAERSAEKMKFKASDDSLGLKSANPATIIGSKAVVLFNTKNRHCEVYVAAAGGKLSVNGAKIINYDEKASVGKTIRHPEDALAQWARATNVRRLEVLMSGVNGKAWELNGKINQHCIILKVIN